MVNRGDLAFSDDVKPETQFTTYTSYHGPEVWKAIMFYYAGLSTEQAKTIAKEAEYQTTIWIHKAVTAALKESK